MTLDAQKGFKTMSERSHLSICGRCGISWILDSRESCNVLGTNLHMAPGNGRGFFAKPVLIPKMDGPVPFMDRVEVKLNCAPWEGMGTSQNHVVTPVV